MTAAVFFIFGTLIGSFLNVVILRLPAEKKLSGRSQCPSCGHTLTFFELIPIVSYLALGGKCRNCQTKISSRYFFIETITGLLFAFAAIYYFSWHQASLLSFFAALLAISIFVVVFVIDLEHFLILDKVVIFGSACFLLVNLIKNFYAGHWWSLEAPLLGSLFAAFAAAGAFYCLWYFSGGRWLGFGDVKLVFLLGLILGWPQTFVMLLLSFWLGALVAIPLLLSRKKKLKSAVPFGCFLTVAAFITLLYGNSLLNWYLRMIGL